METKLKAMAKRSSYLNLYTLLLIGACLLTNILLAKLALALGLPLYLDSIGTILAAAMGGLLPGIIVGFLSNLINGITDPITLYYGIVSILIAAAAAGFSKQRAFLSWKKAVLAVLVFSLLGGGLGSFLTWLLYGFNFGEGISAPYAILLNQQARLPEFFAQLTADLLIDLADKILSFGVVALLLRCLPDRVKAEFPLGKLYLRDKTLLGNSEITGHYRKYSLRSEVVALIAGSAVVISALAISISFVIYKNTMEERYIESAQSAAAVAAAELNPEVLNGYLNGRQETVAYQITKSKLTAIRECLTSIEFLYVYQIRSDGCHVIFDTPTPEVPAGELGDVLPMEEDFAPYWDALLAGEEIPPIITKGAYGWLLTAYHPLYDHTGNCVAYVAADVAMDTVIADRYVFIIKMASLLFGTSILLVVLVVYFADRRMVLPINAMTVAVGSFAYDSETDRLRSVESFKSLNIRTGDELENLYQSLTKLVEDECSYITDVQQKAEQIARIQNSMILSFAEMVESRDENTGEHIRHTAGYVELIAKEMQRRSPGDFAGDTISDLVRSAPLHDIGKIKISDTLLNKPGRLTAKEFEQIKLHTVYGREILDKTMENMGSEGYLTTARAMAAYHHERWDGTGYPEGLRGEDIPMCARIMAVADVFDALISKRSYKAPYSFDRAVEIITEESGTHFDPEVVAAFLATQGSIKALAGEVGAGTQASLLPSAVSTLS